jgi:hypothetical protein
MFSTGAIILSTSNIMKDLTLVLLIGILGFMLINKGSNGGESFVELPNSVSPATIQTIINSIQEKDPDVYPVQTIYINPMADGTYNARIMFINTRGYFGVQYDVQADASGSILSLSEQPMPGIGAADVFKPFAGTGDYGSFDDTQVVLDDQFAKLKTQAPGYQGKLDIWLEQMRATNFANADTAARTGLVKNSYFETIESVQAANPR